MRRKKAQKMNLKIFETYTVLILLATLFMSVVYAQISDIKLQITGTVGSLAPDGVFILDITKESATGVVSDEIRYYKGTTLSTTVELSSSTSSEITYKIYLHNNSLNKYYFKGVSYDPDGYSNTNITYVVNGLSEYVTTIDANKPLDFTIQFKYVDEFTPSASQILNSMLNFEFSTEMLEFNVEETAYTAPAGATWEQFINSEYNTYGFTIKDEKVCTPEGEVIFANEVEIKGTDVISASLSYNLGPEITFDQETVEITKISGENQTTTLTANVKNITGNVTWTSSNTSVADVTGTGSTGTLTLKTAGLTTITVSYGDLSATCNVIVKEKFILELTDTNEGTLSDYRIYGNSVQYGIPTPGAPVEIQSVGDKSKNLVDYTQAVARNTSQTVTIDTTNNAVIWTGDYYFEIPVNILAGETMVLTLESEYINYYTVVYEDNAVSAKVQFGEAFTPEKNIQKIRIYKLTPATAVENMVFKNIMLQYGTEATEYQLYGKYVIPITVKNENGESISTNIYLDEPLRKAGEYEDYIEFSTGQVMRYIASKKLSELTGYLRTDVEGFHRFEIVQDDKLFTGETSMNLISDYFKTINYNIYENNSISERYNYNYIRLLTTDYSTLEELTNTVGSAKIDYVLATPIPEPIELPSIPIFDEKTIIEINSEVAPSNMDVLYEMIKLDKKEINLEIESGGTATTTLTATLENAEGDLTWEVSPEDSGITISGEGNTRTITVSKAIENATITVSCGNIKAKCTVNVTELIPKITLDKNTIYLGVESTGTSTRTLTAILQNISGDLTWESSDTSVAEISGSGNTITIIAKKKGTATITVSYREVSATCTVHVVTTVAEAKNNVLSTTKNTEVYDEYGNKIVVPANFMIRVDDTTNNADDVTEGIVIEDCTDTTTKESQFVWIPCGTVNHLDDEGNETTTTIRLGRYSWSGSTGVIKQPTSQYPYTGTVQIVGGGYFTEYQSSSTTVNAKARNINDFYESVMGTESSEGNGGYYIGRYEAGDSSNTAVADRTETNGTSTEGTLVCKANQVPYNWILQSDASIKCQNMYTDGYVNEKFSSDLINSYAWDTAIVFIQAFGTKNNSSTYSSTLSRSSTGEIATTGTNVLNETGAVDEQLNIYDMAGNCSELSTEYAWEQIFWMEGGISTIRRIGEEGTVVPLSMCKLTEEIP